MEMLFVYECEDNEWKEDLEKIILKLKKPLI